ncbi:MAG: HNH endonuclease [Anaerolineae bacterium]|nr:HNH endonuclease [Anaerolineae bacterium]
MNLPPVPNLPVEHLAASFDKVTNSYKFYWFLAILGHIHGHQVRVIPIQDLLAQMVAEVWYPAHYFRLSFGKQDRLGMIALDLAGQGRLTTESRRAQVLHTVRDDLAQQTAIGRKIHSLGDYVPYRFLRPFFMAQLRGVDDWKINPAIEALAGQSLTNLPPCLYRFLAQPAPSIEIHPAWFDYLNQHIAILSGFCLWHLVNYLQKNNPNVPNIAGKLFEPQERDLKQAKTFWNSVLQQTGGLSCIYSGQPIMKGDFSLDHFLPWRFVAHDLLWNIVPTPKTVNSSKSDNLPDFALYFDPFARLQHQAVQVTARTPHIARLLEDYVLLFKVSSVTDFQVTSFRSFRDTLYQAMAPQAQIAANMGFATGWKYTS